MHFARIHVIRLLTAASLWVAASPVWPLGLDDLTQTEMNGGLKEGGKNISRGGLPLHMNHFSF